MIHGYRWMIIDILGSSMDFLVDPWISMDDQWISPWIINGHPWMMHGIIHGYLCISGNPFRHQMTRHSICQNCNQTEFPVRIFALFKVSRLVCSYYSFVSNFLWEELWTTKDQFGGSWGHQGLGWGGVGWGGVASNSLASRSERMAFLSAWPCISFSELPASF